MVSMEGRWLAAYGKKTPPKPKGPGPVASWFVNNFGKTLNWTPPVDDGGSPITSYGIVATSTDGSIGAWNGLATDRSHDLSDKLKSGRKFSGTIAAHNANYSGTPVNFTGEMGYPGVPTITVGNVSENPVDGLGECIVTVAANAAEDLTINSYAIQYRKIGDSTWVRPEMSGARATIQFLKPDTTYEFQGQTVGIYGSSTWTASKTVTVPVWMCDAPVLTQVDPLDKSAGVRWTYSGKAEPKKFTIYANDGTKTIKQDIVSPNLDGVVDGLTNNTKYTITVTATGYNLKEGAASNAKDVTPSPAAVPTPSFLTLVPGDGQATGTFTPITAPDGYTLLFYSFRATDQNDPQFKIEEHVTGTPTAAVFTPLENDRTYDVVLFAVVKDNQTGDEHLSTESNTLTAHPEKPVAPYKPTVNSANVSPGGVLSMGFSPGTSSFGRTGPFDIDSWEVRRTAVKDSADTETWPISDGNARSFTGQKVPIGSHLIDIRAHNTIGWSPWSQQVVVDYNPSYVSPFSYDSTAEPYASMVAERQYGGYAYLSVNSLKYEKSGSPWSEELVFTRTGSGANLAFEAIVVGAGGGGKGQTVTLGKGGDGGGGDMKTGTLPGAAAGSKITFHMPRGGWNGVHPNACSVTEGSNSIIAASGQSATSAADASGYPRTKVPAPWDTAHDFTWNVPESMFVGGVVLSNEQGFPEAYDWDGRGGSGTGGKGPSGSPGHGGHSLVVLRWPLAAMEEEAPEGKKRRKKWFGK